MHEIGTDNSSVTGLSMGASFSGGNGLLTIQTVQLLQKGQKMKKKWKAVT
jgi:hypothetical protein